MQKIQFYKSNETLSNKFYQIPQELFVSSLYKDKLNSDSKILYGFLLDRLTLSQKNHWIDADNNIYLIFTRQEVQDKLGLSEKTVTKAFKQLKEREFEIRLKSKTNEIENKYIKEIKNLKAENKTLHNMIDKFKITLKKFIKWICKKFSYPSEDEIIRDFYRKTYINFNIEKQLDINEFRKKEKFFDREL